jgi:hypothetical protein
VKTGHRSNGRSAPPLRLDAWSGPEQPDHTRPHAPNQGVPNHAINPKRRRIHSRRRRDPRQTIVRGRIGPRYHQGPGKGWGLGSAFGPCPECGGAGGSARWATIRRTEPDDIRARAVGGTAADVEFLAKSRQVASKGVDRTFSLYALGGTPRARRGHARVPARSSGGRRVASADLGHASLGRPSRAPTRSSGSTAKLRSVSSSPTPRHPSRGTWHWSRESPEPASPIAIDRTGGARGTSDDRRQTAHRLSHTLFDRQRRRRAIGRSTCRSDSIGSARV